MRNLFRVISLVIGLAWGLPFLLWALANVWGFDYPIALTNTFVNAWWTLVWVNVATLFIYMISKKK